VTYSSGITHGDRLWDGSYGDNASLSSGVRRIEIDYAPAIGTGYYQYDGGNIVITSAVQFAATNISIQSYRLGEWVSILESGPVSKAVAGVIVLVIPQQVEIFRSEKLAIEFSLSAVARLREIEYYPGGGGTKDSTGPQANEQSSYMLSRGDQALQGGTLEIRNKSGSEKATIGPGTIRINTGATLNWQSAVVTPTLTGAATQTLTVVVPGATGIFVRSTNARITGECTGTGANNVTLYNPQLLTGAAPIILERYV